MSTPSTPLAPLASKKAQATLAGSVAFNEGQGRIPALNATVQMLIEWMAVGTGATEVFEAFIAGWDAEHRLSRYATGYGQDWTPGVLTEHQTGFIAAGGVVRVEADGTSAALLPSGRVYPMVCGSIIMVDTEDGPVSGRCGVPATRDGACDRHAAEAEEWATASERTRSAWEREESDRDFGF